MFSRESAHFTRPLISVSTFRPYSLCLSEIENRNPTVHAIYFPFAGETMILWLLWSRTDLCSLTISVNFRPNIHIFDQWAQTGVSVCRHNGNLPTFLSPLWTSLRVGVAVTVVPTTGTTSMDLHRVRHLHLLLDRINYYIRKYGW